MCVYRARHSDPPVDIPFVVLVVAACVMTAQLGILHGVLLAALLALCAEVLARDSKAGTGLCIFAGSFLLVRNKRLTPISRRCVALLVYVVNCWISQITYFDYEMLLASPSYRFASTAALSRLDQCFNDPLIGVL